MYYILYIYICFRLPAYDNNRWFALLFVVYVIINMFIFMSIVLAVVYNNYKRHLKVRYRNVIRIVCAIVIGTHYNYYYILTFN